MSLRHVTINGRKVWQARVAHAGLRRSTIRPTRAKAREAEADLLRDLRAQRGQVEAEAAPQHCASSSHATPRTWP